MYLGEAETAMSKIPVQIYLMDTEHGTWCTWLLLTQYGEEVFHHTNLEHYRALTSKTEAVKAKMLIKVANWNNWIWITLEAIVSQDIILS